MKGIKLMLFLLVVFCIVLLGLDFIPVKFAVKTEDILLNNQKYICRTEPKLIDSIEWIAKKNDNSHLDYNLYLSLFGNNPNNYLSPNDFDITYWYELDNAFLLEGNLKSNMNKDSMQTGDLTIYNWEILYPIKRASFRHFYAPKSYLTIYDFKWIKNR